MILFPQKKCWAFHFSLITQLAMQQFFVLLHFPPIHISVYDHYGLASGGKAANLADSKSATSAAAAAAEEDRFVLLR